MLIVEKLPTKKDEERQSNGGRGDLSMGAAIIASGTVEEQISKPPL